MTQANQPDVIIVICDDLGFGDLGCYGGSMIKTPNLDAFAQDGCRFDTMYSGGATCTAARASLLTGRAAVRTGAIQPLRPGASGGIRDSETTLSKRLACEGYQTFAVGKWHVGSMPDNGPTRHGFKSYMGMPYSNDMPPLLVYEDTRVIDPDPDLGELTSRYTERAISEIQNARDDAPLFLYLAHTMPHQPVVASAAFRGRSEAGEYGDVVEEIDARFGELIAAHKKHRPDRDRIVVFTADHGPWFEGAPAPCRGRKFQTWDGGFRVPFLVQTPKGVSLPSVVSAPAATVDIFPTICTWLGLSFEADALDGINIAHILEDGLADSDRPIWFFDNEELNAVRLGKWKCHRRRQAWPSEPFADFNLPQLFDLSRDPDESYDLSHGNPDIVGKLMDMMEAFEQDLSQAAT